MDPWRYSSGLSSTSDDGLSLWKVCCYAQTRLRRWQWSSCHVGFCILRPCENLLKIPILWGKVRHRALPFWIIIVNSRLTIMYSSFCCHSSRVSVGLRASSAAQATTALFVRFSVSQPYKIRHDPSELHTTDRRITESIRISWALVLQNTYTLILQYPEEHCAIITQGELTTTCGMASLARPHFAKEYLWLSLFGLERPLHQCNHDFSNASRGLTSWHVISFFVAVMSSLTVMSISLIQVSCGSLQRLFIASLGPEIIKPFRYIPILINRST